MFSTPTDLAIRMDRDVNTDTATKALTAATQLIQDHCGWHIATARTDTLTLDGNGSGVIALPTLKLGNVLSVTIDGVLYQSTAYQWSASGHIRVYTGSALRSVVVAFVHGYAAVPPIVAAVCESVAARDYVSPEGYTQESFGSARVTPSQPSPGTAGGPALLPHEVQALGRYTIPGVP